MRLRMMKSNALFKEDDMQVVYEKYQLSLVYITLPSFILFDEYTVRLHSTKTLKNCLFGYLKCSLSVVPSIRVPSSIL